MLVIRFLFPSGRYNQKWPPSPFLLARSLAGTCVREIPRMQGRRLERVLNLFSSKVSYALPVSTIHHSTGFLQVGANTPAFMLLDAEPSVEGLFDLKQLLCLTKFLGNTPTWLDADLAIASTMAVNCREESGNNSIVIDTIRSAEDYNRIRKAFPSWPGWVEAILSDESLLLRKGFTQSPVSARVEFNIADGVVREHNPEPLKVASFSLTSEYLPDVTETLHIAEAVRKKLMGISRQLNGGNRTKVSQKFSGKKRDGSPTADHFHAFFLPFTNRDDQKINKVIISSREAFSDHDIASLQRLTSIRNGGKADIIFSIKSFTANPVQESKTWINSTPFITSRHHRKSRGSWEDWMKDELLRELKNHNIQIPEKIESIRTCSNRKISEFITTRKDIQHRNQSAFKLVFKEPQSGPFSIGSLAHFGIGLFLPEGENR